MAQWDGIERAATIAQLVGVDALGLISMIVQTAQAVHRNRETCQELVQDVQLIHDLLRMLQDPEMMRQAEIVNALNGLEGTLQEAFNLVRSCRDCSVAYRVFMGWKQTDQFRRVKKKIAKHLRFYPMISHADITRRLERLSNGAQSTCPSQDAEGMLTPSTSHSNPEARSDISNMFWSSPRPHLPVLPHVYGHARRDGVKRTEGCLEPVELERFQAVTEFIAIDEHQQAGYQEIVQAFSAKKLRIKCGHWLPWKKVETAPCLRELAGPGLSVFHFSELSAATNNFAFECKVESCGYADVYKGRLQNGLDIMIKRSHQNIPYSLLLFENEVRFLAKLQHKNIVKLIGCCIERGEAILVYEHTTSGRLGDAITDTRTRALLNWSERFKIIIGIARGVLYLHECCGIRLMHGDLNPRRILLDSDMTPKITDFACAKIYGPDGREEHKGLSYGTMGYLDPIYIRNGVYSVKSDVYSFGITLLEIISAKRYHGDELLSLWTMGRAMELIDPALRVEPRIAEITRCIQIAVLCTAPDGEDRPTMWDVLFMLSCESTTLPVPKLPDSRYNTQEACESDSDTIEPR